MAPKKAIKMDLGSFLADDSFGGSWADDEVDMSTISVPTKRTNDSFGEERSYQPRENSDYERKEFPIPDAPPYKAKISNLPWEISEDVIGDYFESSLNIPNSVQSVSLPKDMSTGKLKGFGFVTFETRDQLEQALGLSSSEFDGRRIFVNVAAPGRDDGRRPRSDVELDWGAARGPLPPRDNFGRGDRVDRGERPPRREEPDLDWGSARGPLPPRENRGDRGDRVDRGDRPPRREEPELDWNSARGPLPPREDAPRGDRPPRRPKKDEPELDWGSARGPLPPREREPRERKPKQDNFDWESGRTGPLPARESKPRTLRREDKPSSDFDWKRGQALEPRKPVVKSPKAKKQEVKEEETKPAPKSSFNVLAIEGEEEEEEQVPEKVDAPAQEEEEAEITALEEKTADLTVESNEDGWNVVGKK